MAEQIKAELIVQAVSKGFEAVGRDIQKIATAQKKASDQSRKLSASQDKLSEASRRMASATALATQKQIELEQAQKSLITAQQALGVAMAGAATVAAKFLYEATQLAARTETLGIVTETLGRNVGMTIPKIREIEEAVASEGITMEATRKSIALMIQANIDLSNATKLAKLAQDSAVIAGENSSDTFERLTTVISTGSVVMARRLGLMVDFQGAYKREAEVLGKSITDLTALEKVQIRTNEVMRQGENIAGAYGAAMETAGKKVTSIARHWDEARTYLGEAFLPLYADVIDVITDSLSKWEDLDHQMQRQVSAGIGVATAWTGMVGVGLLLKSTVIPGLISSFKGMAVAMSLSTGGLGALVLGIGAAAVAIATYVAKQQAITEELRILQKELVSAGDSHELYARKMKALGEENGRAVLSIEEHAQAQEELGKQMETMLAQAPGMAGGFTGVAESMDMAKGSAFGYGAGMETVSTANIEVKNSFKLMSKGAYDARVAVEQMRLKGVGLKMAIKLTSASLSDIVKHLVQFEDHVENAARNEEWMAEKTKEVAYALEDLSTLIEDDVGRAFDDYADGATDAINKVLYAIIEQKMQTQEFQEYAEQALTGVGDMWGMFGEKTVGAISLINNALEEFARTEDFDALYKKFDNLNVFLSESAEAAGVAEQSFTDMINALDRDIGSTIDNLKEGLEFYMGGGAEVELMFQQITDALNAGLITPEQAVTLMKPLYTAAKDIELELGHINLDEASEDVADFWDISLEQAEAKLLGTTGFPAIFKKLAETPQNILNEIELNEKVAAAKETLTTLVEGPWTLNFDEQVWQDIEDRKDEAEELLEDFTAEDKWDLPISYTELTEVYKLTGDLGVQLGLVFDPEYYLKIKVQGIEEVESALSTITSYVTPAPSSQITPPILYPPSTPIIPPVDNSLLDAILETGLVVPPAVPPTTDYGFNCFVEGTKINTPNGYRDIETLEVGDKVHCYDEKSKTLQVSEIANTFAGKCSHVYSITTIEGTSTCSARHRWHANDRWVETEHLELDDELMLITGDKVKITSILKIPGDHEIYNFTVKDPHNYFVRGHLVHNKQGGADFVVPPGFVEPQRPFMFSAMSGERVTVERAGETLAGGGDSGVNLSFQNEIMGDVDMEEMADLLIDKIAGRM